MSTRSVKVDKDKIINESQNLKTKDIIVANKTTMPILCSGGTRITIVVDDVYHNIVVKHVL